MNIAYIPVRGGSIGIPQKNIKPIAGKPLVYWSAKAAADCADIDRVYVSTDSDDIRTVVNGFDLPKVEVVGRSAASATDTASTEFAMLEFAKGRAFDNIVLIQATSPLVTSTDLQGGFALLAQGDVDSVVSVVRQKRFTWRINADGYGEPANYDYLNRPRRQDNEGLLIENGAFFITGRQALMNSKCRMSGRIKLYLMSPESYIELDEPEDWIAVEQFLLNQQK